MTAEPPLTCRAPTGNIIRLKAAESLIENDKRNPSTGEGISNVRNGTQGPSVEKKGSGKKSGKGKMAGPGKSSTGETHATVGQPIKIKQVSQYPGTVKVKQENSSNAKRVVELGEYLSLLKKGYYCETYIWPLVFQSIACTIYNSPWICLRFKRDHFATGETFAYFEFAIHRRFECCLGSE